MSWNWLVHLFYLLQNLFIFINILIFYRLCLKVTRYVWIVVLDWVIMNQKLFGIGLASSQKLFFLIQFTLRTNSSILLIQILLELLKGNLIFRFSVCNLIKIKWYSLNSCSIWITQNCCPIWNCILKYACNLSIKDKIYAVTL